VNYYEVGVIGAQRAAVGSLTYHNDQELVTGQIVRAPFGKKTLYGVVLSATKKPSFATKPLELVDTQPSLPADLIALARWLSAYYGCDMTQALQLITPRGFGKQRRNPFEPDSHRSQTNLIELSDAQRVIVDRIAASDSRTHLVHGTTGSGKTHIYLALLQQTLAQNKSAILLLPEIALSRHLLERIKPLVSVSIIELSSDLTAAQRHTRWNFIATANDPVIVVGPRSAVFAPVVSLGLIIIDEAHDSSFIETASPHYDASYVAAKRAELASARLILGTATPNISQQWLAEQRMEIHHLPRAHYEDKPQQIEIVSHQERGQFTQHRLLSDPLLEATARSLARGQQSLLFINKRGYSHNVHCGNCGWMMECPDCQLPLTYHKQDHRAQCHTCGQRLQTPSSCPDCQSTEVRFDSPGTQRIEQDINKLFPKANIIRADRDQAQSDAQIRSADILIGTQLLIKGYDLPRLSTVGVLQADSPLGLPDYTASETVYQQLRQVIGRNNRRGQGGQTIVQATRPEHHAVQTAINDDYRRFYDGEIEQRRQANYPPFCHLMVVRVRYKTEGKAEQKLADVKRQLETDHPGLTVLGPSPALRQFAFGYHHWQLLLKSNQRAQLLAIAQQVGSARVNTHINPPSLL